MISAMSWKVSLSEFNNIIAANLTCTFLCCREFTPGMRENDFLLGCRLGLKV